MTLRLFFRTNYMHLITIKTCFLIPNSKVKNVRNPAHWRWCDERRKVDAPRELFLSYGHPPSNI